LEGKEIQGNFRSITCVSVVVNLEIGVEGTRKFAPASPLSVPVAA
jgi:hypothetical protein